MSSKLTLIPQFNPMFHPILGPPFNLPLESPPVLLLLAQILKQQQRMKRCLTRTPRRMRSEPRHRIPHQHQLAVKEDRLRGLDVAYGLDKGPFGQGHEFGELGWENGRGKGADFGDLAQGRGLVCPRVDVAGGIGHDGRFVFVILNQRELLFVGGDTRYQTQLMYRLPSSTLPFSPGII